MRILVFVTDYDSCQWKPWNYDICVSRMPSQLIYNIYQHNCNPTDTTVCFPNISALYLEWWPICFPSKKKTDESFAQQKSWLPLVICMHRVTVGPSISIAWALLFMWVCDVGDPAPSLCSSAWAENVKTERWEMLACQEGAIQIKKQV